MTTARQYLTRSQIARHFGVPESRVSQWVAQGCPCLNPSLTTQRAKYAHLIFKVADVERWLASFTQPAPTITQLEIPFL